MATEDQKKFLIGGGIGALVVAVGFAIFGGKAAAAPAGVPFPQRGPSPRFQPPQRVPTRDHDRTRKKRRRDDDNNARGGRGEYGRGEYGRKKYRRRHGD